MKITHSVFFLVIANLIPLVGVVWWQWSVFMIMLLFWLENIIVGFVNIPRMLFARGEEPAAPYSKLPSRIFLVLFFTLHYGIFTFVHGSFLFSLFGQDSDISFPVILQLVWDYQLYWTLLALFVSHLFSFLVNDIGNKEYMKMSIKEAMHRPYHRIIIMHIGLMAGAFLIQSLHQPLWGLVALIVVKIIMDVRGHRSHHAG